MPDVNHGRWDLWRSLLTFVGVALIGSQLAGCGAQEAEMSAPDSEQAMAEADPDSIAASENDPLENVETDAADTAREKRLELPDRRQIVSTAPQTPSLSPRAVDIAPLDVPRTRMVDGEGTLNGQPEVIVPRLATEASIEPETSPTIDGAATTEPQGAYQSLRVFYGTDRAATTGSPVAGRAKVPLLLIVLAGLTLGLACVALLSRQRRQLLQFAAIALLATVAQGAYWVVGSWSTWQSIANPGVRYGNERGDMVYGTCEVTIPASHARGEVERPSILRLEVREDMNKHVVLQSTNQVRGQAFFDELRGAVVSAERPEVFVFVHGYNVTFEAAARRTAQIAYDVDFAGAPVFFSWPSQGGLLKYTVDETNVEWAVPHLRQFLVDVALRSGAKSVNLIAHSMGNRALTEALRELQMQLSGESKLFNQIILAAPDVDAEIFRRDLAPALTQSAQRVTLYASSNDQALVASRKVHGYSRAGDSGAGIVVLPGIETIDVSTLDTSLLGHSYYGSSDPILLDIRQMIQDALPAAQRPFLLPRSYGPLTYWVFENARTATRNLDSADQ